MRYSFEWDPIKAKENLRKHRIGFERAAEVFLDPMAISTFDEEHSEGEDRWVTPGKDTGGRVVILIHTFLEISAIECNIRIISARRANKAEARQYEDIPR